MSQFSKLNSLRSYFSSGAAIVLGKRALTDIPTILICLITLGVIVRFKKAPEPVVILAAGAVGLMVSEWPRYLP